ncbi:MAG: DUF4129 domain-containing transglutaminase family protein [Anaerolineae bacterium]
MRPPSGWASITLVTLMLLTVAWSIEVAEYAPGSDILTWVVLGGVATAVVLGSRAWLPASLAHGWSIVIGIVVTGVLGTRVLPHYLPGVEVTAMSLVEQTAVVRDWYLDWMVAASGGGPARPDLAPFAFVLTMAALVWLLSYISTWFIVRYVSWWGAVLPSGFALLFNLYQAPQERLKAMAFFLLCALLLAEQTNVTLQLDRWRRERITYSPGIGIDLLRDAVIVALVVVALGWMAPVSLSNDRVEAMLDTLTGTSTRFQTRFNELFPDLNYPTRGGGSAFGETMPLGGSISLGQQAIFEAAVDGAVFPPRYFRMAVFDMYDGLGWTRTSDGLADAEPGSQDFGGDYPLTVPVTQTVRTFLGNTRQLYAMPQPDSFSVAVRAEVATGPDAPDVLAVDSVESLPVGEGYAAVSRQSLADIASLSQDAEDDPAWVVERYLPLPSSVTDRVRMEAETVTAGADNRYDKASLIEAYLRSFEYSEEISDPPDDRDRVDWFLFDEQRGYCDYYSSAFVVMARSVGIPARLAAGYSVGEFVADRGAYRQHEYDAHTWPEVYFPEYGWIEFEPTAGDEPLSRPRTAVDLADQARDRPPGRGDTPEEMLPDDEVDRVVEMPGTAPAAAAGAPLVSRRTLLGAAGLLALFAGALVAASAVWLQPLRGLSAAEGAYARVARVAGWLGYRQRATDTPTEYGARVAGAIPEGRAEIASIVDAYVMERFARHESAGAAERLSAAWRAVRSVVPRAAARLGAARLRRSFDRGRDTGSRADS